jgi:ParB family chromosome partitioning protein
VATRLNRYLDSVSAFDNIEVRLLSFSQNPLRDPNYEVAELVGSIRQHGLLEPIIVRPRGKRFEVLAGNRRLKACKLLKHRRVKCIVTDLDDASAFEVSIAENVQRKTLTPLEEAMAFKKYCDKFGWGSQTELARKIGKSQEYISHRMKLLNLPREVLEALKAGKINTTAAEELVWIKGDNTRSAALRLLETEAVPTKAVRKLSLPPNQSPHNDVCNPDFYPLDEGEEGPDTKLIAESILVLRISLVRLDGIISKAKDPDLRRILLTKRLALHKLIDELVQLKAAANAVVPGMPR